MPINPEGYSLHKAYLKDKWRRAQERVDATEDANLVGIFNILLYSTEQDYWMFLKHFETVRECVNDSKASGDA